MPPLTAADITAAIGMMRDSFPEQSVPAVALLGQVISLTSLGRSLARRVMRQIQWQRRSSAKAALRMDDPADRLRMRLALQDAVNDLAAVALGAKIVVKSKSWPRFPPTRIQRSQACAREVQTCDLLTSSETISRCQ